MLRRNVACITMMCYQGCHAQEMVDDRLRLRNAVRGAMRWPRAVAKEFERDHSIPATQKLLFSAAVAMARGNEVAHVPVYTRQTKKSLHGIRSRVISSCNFGSFFRRRVFAKQNMRTGTRVKSWKERPHIFGGKCSPYKTVHSLHGPLPGFISSATTHFFLLFLS